MLQEQKRFDLNLSAAKPSSHFGGPPPPRVKTPANLLESNFCFTSSYKELCSQGLSSRQALV